MCAGIGQQQAQQQVQPEAPAFQLPPMGGQQQAPLMGEGEKNALIDKHMRLSDLLSTTPESNPMRKDIIERWLQLDGELRQIMPDMPEEQPPTYNPSAYDPKRRGFSI